ncbi:MAG: hypothetical protein QM784_07220 [Polyangiaceae bacterium]
MIHPRTFGLAIALLSFCGMTQASPPNPHFPPPSPELLPAERHPTSAPGFHPAVVLRDRAGGNAVQSGTPLNYRATCGSCHDVEWIEQHGYHFRLGMDRATLPGAAPSQRPWDRGRSTFGRWDPLVDYDGIPPDAKDAVAIDRFIRNNRWQLLGGGPAMLGNESRAFEIDCGRCHVRGAVASKDDNLPFDSYATASLVALGLVSFAPKSDGTLEIHWDTSALQIDYTIRPERFSIAAPTNEACGSCHGLVNEDMQALRGARATARTTLTTGQLFSSRRMQDSAWNLSNRSQLARAWDVHSERLVNCTDCHFSPNDPSAAFRRSNAVPNHLRHDPRVLEFGTFLRRPSHEFARGANSIGQDGGMRRCEDCHDATVAHQSLPKANRHLTRLGCESCHIAEMAAPTYRVRDFTVVDARGMPRIEYRGELGSTSDLSAYIRASEPLLLQRKGDPQESRLYPYNVVTSFFWVVETSSGPRPASTDLLRRALYETPGALNRLTALLDFNRNGIIEDGERHLATKERVDGVRSLLVAAGASNPRLVGETQPYAIHHGVGSARFALRSCDQCHASASRLSRPFILARFAPYGLTPNVLPDNDVIPAFTVLTHGEERWLVPNLAATSLHVFGVNRQVFLDRVGISLIGVVSLGAMIHGLLRIMSHTKKRRLQ